MLGLIFLLLISAASSTAFRPMSSPPSRTFYRRQLPDTVISFSSAEGKRLFASALAGGGAHTFFPLIEQLQTQPEPAFCGLTTLVVCLNALSVDPRRSWKGPWRWYEEAMLNCCVDIEEVKKTGINFSTFACLAKCQGLTVEPVYGSNSTLEEFRNVVRRTCTAVSENDEQPTSFLIVSYTRKVLSQTGTGHFSPIGAYDEESDRVLVLDTARFKYGLHWVKLPLLFDALLPEDPETGKSRGYMTLSYGIDYTGRQTGDASLSPQLPLSLLFGSRKSKDFIRREYKRFMQDESNRVTFESVARFWTNNFTDNNRVWDLVEPQLQPVERDDIDMVKSLRVLIQALLSNDKYGDTIAEELRPLSSEVTGQTMGSHCPSCIRPSTVSTQIGGRALDISHAEVFYVVYLASLTQEERREIVFGTELGKEVSVQVDDGARDQLLSEAALISYAIEHSDVE